MFDKLDAGFQFHSQALSLRHDRQAVLANNIANADTPGFKARDFNFTRQLAAAVSHANATGDATRLSTTEKGHIAVGSGAADYAVDLAYRIPAQRSLDGNSVDMDQERAEFMDNSVRYQASLVMINSYIQGLKSAIQPE